MHSQDPRTKTALAPSTVRTGDGAAASCCPARERSKRWRPSNPVDRLIAATLTPSMPLESLIVRSAATLAQGRRQTGCPITGIPELVGASLIPGPKATCGWLSFPFTRIVQSPSPKTEIDCRCDAVPLELGCRARSVGPSIQVAV
jgi:hypothetical protein